jgi:hypothetical protein
MAATAIIAATINPDTTTWTGKSIAAGAVGSFGSVGAMKDGETITIEKSNGAGDAWEPIKYIDPAGNPAIAQITRRVSTIIVNGPLDYRINKSATAAAVEVVQYT